MKRLQSRRSFLQSSLLLAETAFIYMPGIGAMGESILSPGTRLQPDAEDQWVVAWLERFSSRHASTGRPLKARQMRASIGREAPSEVSMIAEVACFKRFSDALGDQRGFQQIQADGNRIVLRLSMRRYEIYCLLPKDYERALTGVNPVFPHGTRQQSIA